MKDGALAAATIQSNLTPENKISLLTITKTDIQIATVIHAGKSQESATNVNLAAVATSLIDAQDVVLASLDAFKLYFQ